MGANKWQRGENGESRSYAVGVTRRQHGSQQRKRKASVWIRSEAPLASSASPSTSSHPASSLSAGQLGSSAASYHSATGPDAKRQRADDAGASDWASSSRVDLGSDGRQDDQQQQKAHQQQKEYQQVRARQQLVQPESQAQRQGQAEQLQRSAFIHQNRIAAQKASMQGLEARAAAALQAEATAAQAKLDNNVKRKARLDAGFAEAFRKAAEVAAAEAAQQRVVVPTADSAEVARVLAARSHLECLQLPQNPSRDALKKTYRVMAVSLHPDKCKVEHATDAFQRLVQAYQAVLPNTH